MAQRRNASSTGRGDGPSDLDDTKALAAKARSQTGGPVLVPNAAELSGVRPRRDSVIGARLTPPPRASSSDMPNWVWGVLGCLTVLLVGSVGLFALMRAGMLDGLVGESAPAVALAPAPAAAPAEPPSPAAEPAPTAAEQPKAAPAPAAAEAPSRPSRRAAEEPAAAPKPAPEEEAAEDDATPPGQDAVEAALDALATRVRGCFVKYQIKGTARVRLVATPAGTPESVSVTGEFEDTPTGLCVESVVSSAKLPTFKGPPLKLSQSYQLR